jgi:spermidine/putrescine ABC transporter ATP-binding subunit
VREASFIAPSGSFVTLLGPSGSGKTTILKLIAGFEEPTSGSVLIAGKDVTHLPAHRRNIGFVFQQYALFPHLTVGGNIAYSLKMRRLPRHEIRQRVGEVLDLTRLSGLQDRYPAQLSGGQQQRVAVARAIVFRPPVLLMDEPLSALDKRLREEMQYEMLGLQRKLGITTVAVTHDQSEALIMSDVIIVLNNGMIEQIGPSDAVYRRPNSEFVANFLGESNILRGIVRHDGARAYLDAGECFRIPLASAATACEGTPASYIIRPEAIRLGRSEGPDAAEIRGRIIEKTYCGDILRIKVDVGAGTRLAIKLLASREHPAPEPGSEVHVWWNLHDVTTIPVDTHP